MKGVNVLVGLVKYSLLIVIMFFLLFPLYWVILTSFKTNMEAFRIPPTFIIQDPTIASYVNLFLVQNEFFVYYKNNFLISGIVTVSTVLLAILAGYALSRFKFAWNKWIIAALLTSQMFPIISRMISLYALLARVNLLNTRAGLSLAIIAATLPFTAILMSSFFDNVPKEIEEAAYVDGAGRLQILYRIVVPLVRPGILAVGIYAFLMAWDDYLHAATLIQSDELRTLSIGVALRYLGELATDWSLVNTISVVSMLPMIVLFFFFQKHMVKGLVAGAVKG